MKKQLVSLTEQQVEFLTTEADRLGISIAELMRRTVDWYRDTYPALPKKKQAREGKGDDKSTDK